MPDLTYLKIYVARFDDGSFRAGFVNSGVAPPGLNPAASVLFAPYDREQSAGIIDFGPGELGIDAWLSGPGGSPGTGASEFDLLCTRAGEEVHVAVKGTTGDGSAVLLTPGEVTHTREFAEGTALVVVSGIVIEGEGVDLVASGGELHEVRPWEIVDADLRATGFEYRTAYN